MRRAVLLLLVLLAASAAAGLVGRSFLADLREARAKAAHGGKIVSTDAFVLEYAEAGSGTPLLSIHGAGGGYDQGLLIASELIGDGFRVIAPSRFGYLGTPVPADASVAAQADAHAALLDVLDVDKAVVVGTSAGARSALVMALRHPDRVAALVLLVPGTYAPTSPVMVEGSRTSKLTLAVVNAGADFAWWTIQRLAPSVLVRFLGVRPEVVAAGSAQEQARVAGIAASILPLSQRFHGINLDSVPDLHRLPLETIKVPTLVVSSRDDLFNTLPAAEYAAAGIPGARLVAFETGGHLLVGREAATRALLAEFLGKVASRHP
ncbi:MAG: alpha/beta hydrolase [Hyphomicrobiaceae bacterium]|nr:alpha/beta hydrolase [Hyphomicrobiaceae bacterium]